jgi:DNA-binding transcriptional regulator/RsmH inhibitor MraZ
MRQLSIAMMIATPLLLAACGSDEPEPVKAQPVAAAPADPVPLKLTPEGLLGTPSKSARSAPQGASAPTEQATIQRAAKAPAASGPPPEDAPPSQEEVQTLYAGIMFTYAFDACGLPLLGEAARQDIGRRVEICPNSKLRKDAFRTVFQRAVSEAERDPARTRAGAAQACPDKREFLRRVMSHANELQFDSAQPTDCGLLSPAVTPATPANPNQAMPGPSS